MGVLFRDAEALQTLRDVDTLVVDKTGTLTVGRPTLVEAWAWTATPTACCALAAGARARERAPARGRRAGRRRGARPPRAGADGLRRAAPGRA